MKCWFLIIGTNTHTASSFFLPHGPYTCCHRLFFFAWNILYLLSPHPPPQATSIHFPYFLFRSQLKHHINELFLDFSRLACAIAASPLHDVSLPDSMPRHCSLWTIWAITCLPLDFLLECKMLTVGLCLVCHCVPRAWHIIGALGIFIG